MRILLCRISQQKSGNSFSNGSTQQPAVFASINVSGRNMATPTMVNDDVSTVLPVDTTSNHQVVKDMRIVSSLWSDDQEEEEDQIVDNTPSQTPHDPSRYLKDVTDNDDQASSFTPVLLESQKKRMRKKANQVIRAEKFHNTRSKGALSNDVNQ